MFLIALRHSGKLKDEQPSPTCCYFRLWHYESWVITAHCGTVAPKIFFAARSCRKARPWVATCSV